MGVKRPIEFFRFLDKGQMASIFDYYFLVVSARGSVFFQNGSCLADQRPIVLAPSIQHHMAARESRTSSRRVCVFVGDNVGLKQS